MSAFLGPIHYWLYNKIQLQQDLVEEITNLSKVQGDSHLKDELDAKYGISEKRPLEEVIDEMNIHGWLQSQVSQAEYKLAESITTLIKKDSKMLEQLEVLFMNKGKEKGATLEGENLMPSALYKAISDCLLDGMPCDHANTIVEEDEKEVVWKRNTCVHKNYWEAVGGHIKYYYQLREAWIRGFLSETAYVFEKIDEVTYCIKKGE